MYSLLMETLEWSCRPLIKDCRIERSEENLDREWHDCDKSTKNAGVAMRFDVT